MVRIQKSEIILLALVSVVLVSLFSACSWLYPLNPWDDANCFSTIGKSMLEGKVLYREIFDQKGPLLFLLHVASAWAFARPFFGIYLLQILCLFGYLVYGLKIIRARGEKVEKLREFLAMCLLGLVYITSEFYYYGDSVEELSMPALTFAFYHLLAYAYNKVIPSHHSAVLIGLAAAWVFWMKFTVLAMTGGGFLAVVAIATYRHEWDRVWLTVVEVLAGFAVGSLLVILCFVPQHAVADMMEGYFGYNLFRYHVYSEDTDSGMGFYPLRWVLFAVLMAPVLLVKNRDVRLMIACCWSLTLVLAALTTVYIYYFLTVFVFAPVVMVKVLSWLSDRDGAHGRRWAVCFATVAVLAVACNFNLVQLCRGQFPQAILSIRNYLAQQDTTTQQDTGRGLLCYHSRETGIYTYSDYSAPIRLFFQLSVVHQDYLDEQEAYLNSDACRYVIMKDGELNHPDYRLVAEEKELFRTLIFIRPMIWLYNQTGIPALRPKDVANAIPTVADATYSTFRLYERCKQD